MVRRPLKTRDAKWASKCAQGLARMGLRPNQISILSVVFAMMAGACIYFAGRSLFSTPKILLWIGAAVFIQMRLLCNLFDGMVAVEGGFRTKSGEVYNDLPDRFSDIFILVPVGYSAATPWAVELAWLAALLAVMTAYVRMLAGACGAIQRFLGPMAKPHRMATMTIACLLAVVEVILKWPPRIMGIALVIIVIGCVVTIVRRCSRLMGELESK